MKTIEVSLSQNPYTILVGQNLESSLGKTIKSMIKGKRLLIISSASIPSQKRQKIVDALQKDFEFIDSFLLEDGESNKSWESVHKILEVLFAAHYERIDGILAFGGGIIGDLSGFCASIYKRGIPFIQYPTTLLAQVDAAIGGKTGINSKEGKNLIGSFYQPKQVICDINILDSLPQHELQNGFAEIIKYAFIEKVDFYHFFTQNLAFFAKMDIKNNPELWIELIAKCANCKARIVAQDEKESHIRETLNYGHTIGHAIEKLYHFQISHGQAVALGMLIESKLATLLDQAPQTLVSSLTELLKAFKFNLKINLDELPQIIDFLGQDKKTKHQNTPILVPKEIGKFQKILLPEKASLLPLLQSIIKEINS